MGRAAMVIGLLVFAPIAIAQIPTEVPTEVPTEEPTEVPTEEPTDTPTETPIDTPTETLTPAPTATATPTPLPNVAVVVDKRIVEPGEPIPASGVVPYPGQTYTLCLADNGSWTIGDPIDCSICLSTADFTPPEGPFSGIPLPGIPEQGEYDILLLDGFCNGPLEMIAADSSGPDEGVVVAAFAGVEVPELMLPAAVFLMGLLALTGWIILRRG